MSGTELLDILGARHGIVCAVGAGGKKTTLYRLLAAHPGRAAFTSTVFTYTFPDDLAAQALVAPPQSIVAEVEQAARTHAKLAFACPSEKAGRLVGLTSAQVVECHQRAGFDLTLVKADGARMRLIKAPDVHEPNLVAGAATVLALVSARVIGLPLTPRCAHRPERVAAVTGAVEGEVLTPLHVARLIASADGLLRGVGEARVVPVINMAESPAEHVAARHAARIALDLSDRYERVVIAAMRAEQPIVEVVERACG